MATLFNRERRVMAPTARSLIVVTLCACVLVPNAFAFMAERNDQDRSREAASAIVAGGRSAFRIRGHVMGLTPGSRKALRLRVVNPNRYPIRVVWLSARVRTPNRPGCSARSISLPEKRIVSLRIAARGRAVARYPVRLRANSSTKCQSAQWPLRYRGEARRIG